MLPWVLQNCLNATSTLSQANFRLCVHCLHPDKKFRNHKYKLRF